MGGRPPRGGVSGSAKNSGNMKQTGLHHRLSSAPKMEHEGEDELTAEQKKIAKLKNEMEQVEIDIIQNGGVNCGWEASDHKDFLRLHTQMAGKTGTVAFFTAMARAVPLADENQVREHLKAYQTYTNLTKKKKELLADYKAAKEEERIAKMTRASKVTDAFKRLNSDLDLDMEGKRNSSSVAGKRTGDLSMEERNKMKE